MRTIVVLAVLCSICVAVNALSIANERSQLQTKSKVKAETPNLAIMQAAFGIVAKTFQADSVNGRGNNIMTILGYYSAQQDKTIPFIWGLNCVGVAGRKVGQNDKKWPHGERVALDLFKKFCDSNAMSVAACQDLWSNMVVYSTLQPCSKCSVELATFMGKPPKAVYYGATDTAGLAGVATVFPAPACKTARDYTCEMKVSSTAAAGYRDEFEARATKYKDYLKRLGQGEDAKCKAGYLRPSNAKKGSYPAGFLQGVIKDYISNSTTVTFYNRWSTAGGQEAAALVNAVPTDGTCEGFFAAGKKAVNDAVRKPVIDKCNSCFDSKGDKKLYFCKYNKKDNQPGCALLTTANNNRIKRERELNLVGCDPKSPHAISTKEDCAENKLYTSV